MDFQVCSDLHLEFSRNREWIRNNPIIPKSEHLIIAGDTYYLDRDFSKLDFIEKISQDFKQVYIIPGNHEYYGGYDVSSALIPQYIEIKKNVVLLNNQSLDINAVNFVFSTMWSKIEKNVIDVLNGLNDFRLINYNGQKFNIKHFNQVHDYAFKFIKNALQPESKNVIITHHLPSNYCNIDAFKNSSINEAFCVDKTYFIRKHSIACWVYAHSHRNKADFKIGQTKMITNQLGYVGLNEHYNFKPDKVIQI